MIPSTFSIFPKNPPAYMYLPVEKEVDKKKAEGSPFINDVEKEGGKDESSPFINSTSRPAAKRPALEKLRASIWIILTFAFAGLSLLLALKIRSLHGAAVGRYETGFMTDLGKLAIHCPSLVVP